MQGLREASSLHGLNLVGVQSVRGAGLSAPFIAFVNGNHFVLVREVNNTDFLVDDVHSAKPEWIPKDAFLSFWDGKALISEEQALAGQVLDMDSMVGAKGGTDPLPDPNNAECRNNELCCKCPYCPSPPPPASPGSPTPRGPSSNGEWVCGIMGCTYTPGDTPSDFGRPGPGGPSTGTTSPSKCASGYNPEVMLFQMSLQTTETDLSMSTAGGMKVNFTRVFANQFGYKRRYFSSWSEEKPYRNNIGEGWTHNLNMHLRVSQLRGAVQFVDEDGNPKTYTKYDTDDNFDYYWRRATSEYEAHGYTYKGHAWEQGITLTRDKISGAYTMYLPDGRVYGFTAETAWPEHYARLVYMSNASGTQVTMQYDGLGRLTQALMPSGDGRYLQLYYSGTTNRMTQAEIRTATQSIESIYYEYDGYLNLVHVHRGDPLNPYNDISTYVYDSDPNVQYSFYLSSMTDASAVTSTMDYTYAIDGEWGVLSSELVLHRSGMLATRYTRSAGAVSITTVENLGVNFEPLNKIVYTSDWYLTTLISVAFHLSPTGNNCQKWAYSYNTDMYLTEVKRPCDNLGGTVWHERYTYTDKGKVATVSRYTPGVPGNCLTTAFDYDESGLLLIRRTDPNGLATEYEYDGYGRLVQMTHPSLGANGFQYAYDSQGNRTSVTDPLGNTTSFVYDARGNLASTTNQLNQTTTMTYDDLGRVIAVTDPLNNTTEYEYVSSGCGCGGTGKLARITDPLDQETSFSYDALGNMVLTTDALGRSTAYEYDAMKRMTAVEFPAGSNKRMTFTYNRLGHMVSSTDFMGRTSTMTYDHQGRITSGRTASAPYPMPIMKLECRSV